MFCFIIVHNKGIVHYTCIWKNVMSIQFIYWCSNLILSSTVLIYFIIIDSIQITPWMSNIKVFYHSSLFIYPYKFMNKWKCHKQRYHCLLCGSKYLVFKQSQDTGEECMSAQSPESVQVGTTPVKTGKLITHAPFTCDYL